MHSLCSIPPHDNTPLDSNDIKSTFNKTNLHIHLTIPCHIQYNQLYCPQRCLSQGQFSLCRENNECATVLLGGFHLSPPSDHTHVRHETPTFHSITAHVVVISIDALLSLFLSGSHASLTGSTFVSSPLTQAGCSITTTDLILPLHSLNPAFGAGKEKPLPHHPRSVYVFPAHFTGEGASV